MQIVYKQGNLLDCNQSFIAHSCNNKGAFASGVAGDIRKKHPKVYQGYIDHKVYRLGEVIVVEDSGKIFFNIIGQDGYGRDGRRYVRYDALVDAFEKIDTMLETPTEVAMPLLGSGLGGGKWSIVSAIIEETKNIIPIVYVLEISKINASSSVSKRKT
ncbi:MAG: hypothetical protein WC284_12615 [Candidimonas sp.]